MSLFLDSADLNSHGRYLAQLLLSGGVQLEMLAKGKERVTFGAWLAAVLQDVQKRGIALSTEQAEWLWETLTREPRVAQMIGTRIVSADEEWLERKPVRVLKAGEYLGVFLKSFKSLKTPIPSEAQPQGRIKLLGELIMTPGKVASRRFACDDVKCVVEIEVGQPGTVEQEAILMKVEPKDITVDGTHVNVRAKSVNHAFTLTSRRLQPGRRGYGGRAYDYIAWRCDQTWMRLEDIRCSVETGKWGEAG